MDVGDNGVRHSKTMNGWNIVVFGVRRSGSCGAPRPNMMDQTVPHAQTCVYHVLMGPISLLLICSAVFTVLRRFLRVPMPPRTRAHAQVAFLGATLHEAFRAPTP